MRNRSWFINAAISFDGKISVKGQQVEISSKEDWQVVHRFRNEIAAIVVGSNTIKVDNPSLQTKPEYLTDPSKIRHPIRVVLDRRGTCDPNSKVFQDQDTIPTLWVTESTESIKDVQKIPTTELSQVVKAVNSFCDNIGRDGDVMVEGGSVVINNFIESGLVSKLRLYRNQLILENGVPLFPTKSQKTIVLQYVKKLGSGIEEIYQIK